MLIKMSIRILVSNSFVLLVRPEPLVASLLLVAMPFAPSSDALNSMAFSAFPRVVRCSSLVLVKCYIQGQLDARKGATQQRP